MVLSERETGKRLIDHVDSIWSKHLPIVARLEKIYRFWLACVRRTINLPFRWREREKKRKNVPPQSKGCNASSSCARHKFNADRGRRYDESEVINLLPLECARFACNSAGSTKHSGNAIWIPPCSHITLQYTNCWLAHQQQQGRSRPGRQAFGVTKTAKWAWALARSGLLTNLKMKSPLQIWLSPR